MSKTRVNYKSDLPPIEVTFKVNTVAVDVPNHDFVLRFFVEGCSESYYCGCKYEGERAEYFHCSPSLDGSKLTCYINNHKFMPGRVCVEYIDLAPDNNYEDGVKKTVVPDTLDVVLIDGAGDEVDNVVADTFNYKVGRGILDVQKTGTAGIVDTYTITYDDGTSTTYTVTNGRDGVNLGDVAIADDLFTNDGTKVLSARQGYVLSSAVYNDSEYDEDNLIKDAIWENHSVGTVPDTMNTVSGFGCLRLEVEAGDMISISTKASEWHITSYCVTDTERTVLESAERTDAPTVETILIEEDGYVFINCKSDYYEYFSVVRKYGKIKGLNSKIDVLSYAVFGDSEYDDSDLTKNAVWQNHSVDTVPDTRNDVSGFGCLQLEVKAGDTVSINTKASEWHITSYCVTDRERAVLESAARISAATVATIVIEQDGYVFVNCESAYYSDFSIIHKYSKIQELEEKLEDVPGEAAELVYDALEQGNGKSKNYAIYEGHNCYIPDLWGYDEDHSAATDIQNNVQTSSSGNVFKDPIVSKIARYSGMASRRWKQYFSQGEGVGSGSVIADLLSFQQQDSGSMLPLQMKATFYNPGEIPIAVTLMIALGLDVTYSGDNYVYPSSEKVVIPAGGSVTASFSYMFPDGSNLTWGNVTSIRGYSITDDVSDVAETDPIWLEMGDVDVWFEDTQRRVNRPFINPELIKSGITESQLAASLQEKINSTGDSAIDRNLRICCAGSSVTWGDGYLQSSMMKYLIPMLQSQHAAVIPFDRPTITGVHSTIEGDNWRQLYEGKATKLTGANASLEFDIEGDELTICQAIERSNANASIIEVYVDSMLYGSFSNFNPDPIGSETKTFTATAGQKEFILERPFTYNHVVTVDGVAVTANLNMQGQGGTIPTGHWGMICRDVKDVDGETKVVHTLFAKEGQSAGAEISVTYDYGHEILYEKTTIGKDGNGTLESAFGRGYTAFDPAHPQDGTFESGLDFRCTDERAMVRYRFDEKALRHVKLVVKELDSRATNSSGTPYFIFNFATNRIMYFQNAGIGGYRSSYFISDSDSFKLRTWKEIADFQPDIVLYESAPNDDWSVGYKLYSVYDNLSLTQLRQLRTLPNKEISYDSANDEYCYKRYAGIITAITKNTVTFDVDSTHVIASTPAEGDVVQVGTYHSNNKEVVARLVSAYNATTHTITFDRPICERDYIYDSLDDFVGLEIQVRDLSSYGADTTTLCNRLKAHCDDVKIGLVCNPAANLHSRNLEFYRPYLDKVANKVADYYVDLSNVYDWQTSHNRDKSVTVNVSSLVTDSLTGYKAVVLDTLDKAKDWHNFAVFVDDVNVYGKDAFVDTIGYGVSHTSTGSSLATTNVKGGSSETQMHPRLIFVKNAPTTGTITVKCSNDNWSRDSTHLTNIYDDYGRKLYAIGYKAAIMGNLEGSDSKESQGGGGGGDQVQADWNQSDSTAVDYIKNKPTIPAAQVQSDWNEASSSSKAYIQNKPTIPTKTSDLTNDSCPIIEDTRSQATDVNITGAAPFATLTGGQRIVLYFKYANTASPTLQLTLSGGTTTSAYPLYQNYNNGVNALTLQAMPAGSYGEFVFDSTNSRWVLVGKDYNTTYSATYQADINNSAQGSRLIEPKLLRDNFYLKSEVNNICPIIEDTRSSNAGNITGVAPFNTLVDKQKVIIHLAYTTGNYTTLQLTLNDGVTTTNAIPIYARTEITWVGQIQDGHFRGGTYMELIYNSSENRWYCLNLDRDTTTWAMSQTAINNASNTDPRAVPSAKLIHDNAYIVEETYSSGSLKANKMYDFGTVSTALTIPSLDATNDLVSNALNFYALRFIAGADNISITFPTGVIVDDEPTINTDDYVEIMINKYGNNFYASIKVWQAQ